MVNTFDERDYEYTYKNWCDPMKICHLKSYDFEILEKDKSEVCTTPEFKLTNQIDGAWMMQYKPYGSNSPSSSSPYNSSTSLLNNFPLGGMFKGIMKHVSLPNASLTLHIKGNKAVNARWQWILKSRNPTPFAPRTAEQTKKFEASNSYGLGGNMSLTTFFENGKAIVQIKGLLTWNPELCKNPSYGISTIHVQNGGGSVNNKSKTSSIRSPPPRTSTTAVTINETPAFMKIIELEKQIFNLQRDLDESNDENSILKKKIKNFEKEIVKSQNRFPESRMSSDSDSNSYNKPIISKLQSQNFELQQKNVALEEEIKKLN
uniref:Uncharacterized protein n=1 Tax=Panagrolaimus superbus TaxID=310955 RepID=A0A914YH47_9BILA